MSARRRNERCYDDGLTFPGKQIIIIALLRREKATPTQKKKKKKGKKKGDRSSSCNGRERETHSDLIGSRILVHLEDRVVIVLRDSPVVVSFLLRSRFLSTHDN